MDFLHLLRDDGIVQSPAATLTPLTGGVSSEIYRVDDGDRVFVVKRALHKLKVQQDWFADPSRNFFEFQYLRYVSSFLPAAVPKPLLLMAEHGYFTMEYLGEGFANWKQQMLAGEADASTAARAGTMLGKVHAKSAGDQAAAAMFDTLANFEQLRIDPYLLATAKKHPELAKLFHEEADRLRAAKRVLTHGDFSPKNVLVSPARVVLVDCEVAWFGDAAFDVAFALNHLLLKSIARPAIAGPLRTMAQTFWKAYTNAAGDVGATESDVARLLLMLMLARIDGKSPVEYLSEPQRRQVRTFAIERLSAGAWELERASP